MAIIIRASTGTASTDLPVLAKDALIQRANGAMPWLVDLGWAGGYDGQTPVPSGKAVPNMVDGGDNSAFVVPGAGPVVAGGGVSFAPVDASGTYLSIPPSVAAAVAANSQRFLFCMWVRFPSEANWAAASAQQRTILNWTNTGAWNSNADLLAIRMVEVNGVKQLLANRQTAIGGSSQLAYSGVPSEFFDAVAQVSVWRTASEMVFSVRTQAGRQIVSGAAGADNSESISGLTGKIGMPAAWGASPAADPQTRNFRLYRAFVEIPAISGRVPLQVLDQDWDQNFSRFS